MKPRSPATISYTMSRIRGKNTGIELLLRQELTKRGLHYRHNSSFVFGHPDVSFKGYKVAVFCDSEFWHGYHFEENAPKIKSHQDYWIPKIERNIARDEEVNQELAKEGYLVLRFWGKELEKDPAACAEQVVAALKSRGYPKKSRRP
jgi:DNA mismatch endonuclease, patch repair protein